jgi:hypothetical protein
MRTLIILIIAIVVVSFVRQFYTPNTSNNLSISTTPILTPVPTKNAATTTPTTIPTQTAIPIATLIPTPTIVKPSIAPIRIRREDE